MENPNMDWQSHACRQGVVDKINDALITSGTSQSRSALDMENHVFQKSNSREEYMNLIMRIIMHIQNQKNKKQQPETMPDPINALQNLATQGTRNTMPSQMMSLGGMGPVSANQNANVLQNLIHQRSGPGQQHIQPMPNMQAVRGAPGGQQPLPGNMQQSNMPPGAMNAGNINMGGVIGQQAPNASGQMPGNMIGQINQMQMRDMNVQGPQINAINTTMSMNMNPSMQQNQMNANMNQGMNPNQVSQLLGRMSTHQAGAMGQQMNQMNSQIINQIGTNAPGNIPGTQPPINPNMMANQNLPTSINQPNVGPNQMNVTGQMNMSPMLNMGHMARNQPGNVLYQVRNAAPNQPYFRKSPSPSAPSAPSPMGANIPNQMVPSPALVPSPQVSNIMSQRNVMAPSPSSTNLNTPGQAGAVPSPLNPQEEQLYREKYRQLTKYIEPLRRMVARIGNDDEKLLKMNKLLEILCNPNQRIPLETLTKCEIALEKMDLKSYSMPSSNSIFGAGSKEHPMSNALLEAVSSNLQSPISNHTLQRTFRPCLEALFGPDIKNLPSAKQMKLSTSNENRIINQREIPHLLQGEIARLDQKFKISIDPTSQGGTKIIKLVCSLEDKCLPFVPPMNIIIPEDYPAHSPTCSLIDQEYNATPFLSTVQKSLIAAMSMLPKQFSLSHLLDTWEMSIRKACVPNTPTTPSLLVGA